jgi:hypothetical protein
MVAPNGNIFYHVTAELLTGTQLLDSASEDIQELLVFRGLRKHNLADGLAHGKIRTKEILYRKGTIGPTMEGPVKGLAAFMGYIDILCCPQVI